MPAFADSSARHGVHLLKRAQLVTVHLHERLSSRDARFAFGDLDRLTVFADNVLPAMLCSAGCVRLAPALAARVDAGDPLPVDSDEEVALRAVSVAACEAIVSACAQHQPNAAPLTTRELDLLLWGVLGKGAQHRNVPRHMTRGTWKY